MIACLSVLIVLGQITLQMGCEAHMAISTKFRDLFHRVEMPRGRGMD